MHMHVHVHMPYAAYLEYGVHMQMYAQPTDDKRLEDAPHRCCGGGMSKLRWSKLPVRALEEHELAPSQARDLARLGW